MIELKTEVFNSIMYRWQARPFSANSQVMPAARAHVFLAKLNPLNPTWLNTRYKKAMTPFTAMASTGNYFLGEITRCLSGSSPSL